MRKMSIDYFINSHRDDDDTSSDNIRNSHARTNIHMCRPPKEKDALKMFRYYAHTETDITNDMNCKMEWKGEKWNDMKSSNYNNHHSYMYDCKRARRKRKAYSVLIEHPVGDLECSNVKLHFEGTKLIVGIQEKMLSHLDLSDFPDLDLSTVSCKLKKGFFILKSDKCRPRRWSSDDSKKEIIYDHSGDKIVQFLIPVLHGSMPEQVKVDVDKENRIVTMVTSSLHEKGGINIEKVFSHSLSLPLTADIEKVKVKMCSSSPELLPCLEVTAPFLNCDQISPNGDSRRKSF